MGGRDKVMGRQENTHIVYINREMMMEGEGSLGGELGRFSAPYNRMKSGIELSFFMNISRFDLLAACFHKEEG